MKVGLMCGDGCPANRLVFGCLLVMGTAGKFFFGLDENNVDGSAGSLRSHARMLVCCAGKPIEATQRESARDDGRSRASLGCDGGDADIYFGMFEKDWHRIGENFDNIFEECGKILGNDLRGLLWIGDGNMTATGIFRLLSALKT